MRYTAILFQDIQCEVVIDAPDEDTARERASELAKQLGKVPESLKNKDLGDVDVHDYGVEGIYAG